MSTGIHTPKPNKGSTHKVKRIGRGPGSGRGKTAGRGMNGQWSRAGTHGKRGFEGGQMPLHRRLPKRGFTNIFRKEFAIVNVATLEKLEGTTFDAQTLLDLGVIHKLKDGLKILGSGELTRKITVTAAIFSESAKQKIEAAGGTTVAIAKPDTVLVKFQKKVKADKK